MTNLTTDYLQREKAANATPQGADHRAILRAVAADHDVTYAEARRIIIGATVGPLAGGG